MGCYTAKAVDDEPTRRSSGSDTVTDESTSDAVSPGPTDIAPGPTDTAPGPTDTAAYFTETEDSSIPTDDPETDRSMPTDDTSSDSTAPVSTDTIPMPVSTDETGTDSVLSLPTDSEEQTTEPGATDTETDALREPENHRAVAETCDTVREVPEPSASVISGISCTSDEDCAGYENGRCVSDTDGDLHCEYDLLGCRSHAECTEGENGRCEYRYYTRENVCTYDECFADEDCPAGIVCHCRGDYGNACYTEGNCLTDADCGPGYCSPTRYCLQRGFDGYYCHTPQDECIDDSDCQTVDTNGVCAYDAAVGRWICRYDQCVV